MYNYNKLSGRIREKYGKNGQATFALKMGLSERTISLKLNNERDFKQREINRACEILDIDVLEIPLYFFQIKVQ